MTTMTHDEWEAFKQWLEEQKSQPTQQRLPLEATA